MKLSPGLRLTALLLAFATFGGAASAQVSCERYRAELASLNRVGATMRAQDAVAQRQRNELLRLAAYYRSIGCEQGSFFFQVPPECGAIAQRIRALQVSAAELASQATADPGAIEARRRQLQAAIARTCDLPRAEAEPQVTIVTPPSSASGGSRLVCVRACDGFFFPLEATPRGRTSHTELCRALCPNAEVSVYRAPADGGIEQAVSETGKPYMQLANALRYTKAADPSCSCRKQGESWAQALQKAERMIARDSSDIIVTAKKAEQLSQISLTRPKVGAKAGRSPAAAEPPSAAMPARDPETTGSVPLGTPARPRIIAPDRIPVPGQPE